MPRAKQRTPELRDRLLEVAVGTLNDEGVARLTTRRVADVEALVPVLRRFCLDSPRLAQVMFSRPFADFDPGPEELAAGESVRNIFLDRIQRCLDEGALAGDAVEIAHVLLALAKGLAVQEAGRWLGTTARSVERRWRLGVRALLTGFSCSASSAEWSARCSAQSASG